MKLPIRPAGAPAPRGPYSAGVVTGGRLLFTAGQLPIDPATNEVIEGDIEAHARQALANLVGVIRCVDGSASLASGRRLRHGCAGLIAATKGRGGDGEHASPHLMIRVVIRRRNVRGSSCDPSCAVPALRPRRRCPPMRDRHRP